MRGCSLPTLHSDGLPVHTGRCDMTSVGIIPPACMTSVEYQTRGYHTTCLAPTGRNPHIWHMTFYSHLRPPRLSTCICLSTLHSPHTCSVASLQVAQPQRMAHTSTHTAQPTHLQRDILEVTQPQHMQLPIRRGQDYKVAIWRDGHVLHARAR